MFNRTKAGIDLWVGNPDCQAAHDTVLDALKECHTQFFPKGTPLTNPRKGNLGEFIALRIGSENDFSKCRVIAANAHDPFSEISRPDIDLLWIFLGAKENEDFLVVQEVKTTEGINLAYADSLIDDYEKLFAANIRFTLQSRCDVAANKMEGMGVDKALCCRVTAMAGITPQTSPKVRLIPTLVHEMVGANPTVKMLGIKSTIVSAYGWPAHNIDCWAIALTTLTERFQRISWGES